MWSKRNHQRQGELQITATTLFLPAQSLVELPEKLENSLFSATVACSRVLDSKWMDATIMTTNLQASVGDTDSPHKVNSGNEAINPNKVLVLVLMLEVLPWHFDLIEFLVTEFTEVRTKRLE